MIWLVLGLLVWTGAHFFKRLAPRARLGMGDAGKGLVAAASGVAVVLMVIGFRMAGAEPLWALPSWAWHLNNLLMAGAVLLFGLSHSRSRLKRHLRHPMLLSVVLWAGAHLLVNGDLPSLVLFGGMGLWALAEIAVINRAVPRWTPPAELSARGDLIWLGISAVLFAVIAGVHMWIGPSPFPAGAA